jgi:ATP-dependent helicase/nuclease subunit B
MAKPTVHFIGNDSAAPLQIVEWCQKQWPDALPAGLVFCVPTALAMRRLRDALTLAYTAIQGVRFSQPAGLISYFKPHDFPPQLTESERLCVWDRVFDWLAQADQDNLVAEWLFPGENAWLTRPAARYTVAQRLIKLRMTLVEAGLDFNGVANHPQTKLLDTREQSRWAALDVLETKYREQLAELNLSDPVDLQLATLQAPTPAPIEGQEDWRLIIACVPDLMPILSKLFEAAPHCDILVQATPDEAEHFTDYGTPAPTYWLKAPLQLPSSAITLAETPADEAIEIEHFLGRKGTINPSQICLGVLNHEIMPFITSSFETHGIQVFEPDPIQLSKQPAARLLRDLFQLAKTHRIEFLLPLLIVPEITAFVQSDYATLRKAFVEFIDIHRPATLYAALPFLKEGNPETRLMEQILKWTEDLQASPCEGALRILVEIFGAQVLDPVKDALRFATFEALQEIFAEINTIRVPDAQQHEALLFARINQTTLHPIRGTAESSFEGRFEILWSKATDFAIAGLNEGIFPDTTFEDAFLPNNFRKALALRSDLTRFARDAYILDTLCKRCAPEHLKFTCSRLNSNGDWLKPSRLFFHCESKEQQARAKTFFIDAAEQASATGELSKLAFTSTPDVWLKQTHRRTRLSASAIRAFLASPFQYWMYYECGLSETAPLEEGVQANDFGTMIHEAMLALCDTKSTDADTIYHTLEAAFNKVFFGRYGKHPDVELLALHHSALRRLKSAAQCEAGLRQEGWETRYVEHDTRNKAWEVGMTIEGQPITLYGQIDRIDYNAKTNTWRVIDYKTGTSPKPSTEHYSKPRGTDVCVWKNFQLPIYRLLTRHALQLAPEVSVEMAYFALPARKTASILTLEDPVCEADTVESLKEVLKQMLMLSPEMLLQDADVLSDPLLKHLLSSCKERYESYA